MKMSQIQNLYRANGIKDYKLRTTEDLLNCHGIDYKSIDGYSRLDDFNKAIYEKFIINFYNDCGLESRAGKIPTGIYFVEDTEFLFKRNNEDEFYVAAGGVIKAIDKNGMKSVLHTWNDEDNPIQGEIREETSTYLRFEYQQNDRPAWLHIIEGGEEWY